MSKRITFNQLVDELAGVALIRLIRGENWRSIIWFVCQQARHTELKP